MTNNFTKRKLRNWWSYRLNIDCHLRVMSWDHVNSGLSISCSSWIFRRNVWYLILMIRLNHYNQKIEDWITHTKMINDYINQWIFRRIMHLRKTLFTYIYFLSCLTINLIHSTLTQKMNIRLIWLQI